VGVDDVHDRKAVVIGSLLGEARVTGPGALPSIRASTSRYALPRKGPMFLAARTVTPVISACPGAVWPRLTAMALSSRLEQQKRRF
jgi:hypothetical protein